MTIRNNLSMLPLWKNRSLKHKNKSYVFENNFTLFSDLNQIPPFQLILGLNSNITSAKLINQIDYSEIDIFSELVSNGLQSLSFSDYSISLYPASTTMNLGLTSSGIYELVVSDGQSTWYSADFQMCVDVSHMIKIEFSHSENIFSSEARIAYPEGFKNFVYLNTEIGKPSYPYIEKVKKLNGRKRAIRQSRYKVHRFSVLLPEFMIDILRTVWLHDYVKITCLGIESEIFEFNMNDPDWLDHGDLADVTFEILSDNIVTSKGTGIVTGDGSPPGGGCFMTTYEAEGQVVSGDQEYSGNYIIINNQQIPLELNDYLIVDSGFAFSLQEFTGSYNSVTLNQNEIVYDKRSGKYWYQDTSLRTLTITSVISPLVTGYAVPNSIVEIWGQYTNGSESLIGVGTQADFTSSGVSVLLNSSVISVYAKASNPICGIYQTSNFFTIDFLCPIVSRGEYPSDNAAAIDLEPEDYYHVSQDNVYGVPRGLVRQLAPPASESFNNDAQAWDTNGYFNICYKTAGFEFGIQEGFVRVAVVNYATYKSKTEAAANGVGSNEPFVLGVANEMTFQGGFVMINY